MRALRPELYAVAAALLALSPACSSCSNPTTVTIQVVNQLSWPIYMHDENDQLGVTIQRSDGTNWVDLQELADCSCDECENACLTGGCTCPTPVSWAHRLDPAGSAQRTWAGEYRVQQTQACLGLPVTCLGDRQTAEAGTYRAKLCWASSLAGNDPTQVRFKADFPADLSCSTKDFNVPGDTTVEVVTAPPPGCSTQADCASDQMCLEGQCSSTCIPNDVPALDASWTVEVGEPDDAGFFTTTTAADGSEVFTGTGTVSTVHYTSGTTNLTLTRAGGTLDLTAGLYYTLPAARAVPLNVGDQLDVTVVEYTADPRNGARAITLSKQGKLLLAADTGLGGPVLTAAQIAPFTVDIGGTLFACTQADCGRRSFELMTFAAGGQQVVLEAGKSAQLASGADTYEVVAVANYSDEVAGCDISPVSPYVIMPAPASGQ